ncbi:adenosylcobalamin-dependent ribonucleoside-diphosphate reductase [Halospeciosus flavus]|uniref:Vitamin B12-dependent ribonucleotide reductase n=1 Tax=Halospeciosus flavus TaxID=3032283 RepID=A0ABD5Z8B6_9EURY|nr:adenosylcobalamin-dependent ribonucleoside-diphosphate reductase [Halospeciosus flavus]
MDVTLPVKRVTGETVAERLTENARERILPARYLLKDEQGEVVETPAELFERVATAVAAVEEEHGNDADRWAERFEELMTHLEFVPNSPTLMNAGTELGQLSACFVISPDDDLGDIFDVARQAAEIFQSGGGVGYSFSALRPKGDVVQETGGIASGPVSFMSVYDQMCETIKAGGKRRGAQMGMLRADHPDVGRFCVAKREEGRLENFNLSVAATREFYEAVQDDEEYTLYNPRTGEPHEVTEWTARFYNESYAETDPDIVEENVWRDYADEIPGIEAYRGDLLTEGEEMTLPARFVWRLMVDGAWRNGEPGLFLLDQANAEHSFDVDAYPDHRIEATNPCGEQPLEDYEACNLGHVNLSLCVADDPPHWDDFRERWDGDAEAGDDLDAAVDAFLDEAVDFDRLDRIARLGTRFLDDVVTASDFPLDEIEETVGRLRKVGLGVMGFAELLVQLGVRYGSDASVEVARQLMARIDHVATQTSHDLAAERGVFPAWEESKYADPTAHPEWFRRHTGEDPAEWEDGYPIRNHGLTSIAPTGTTSMIADTSAGCEPLYDVVYFKNVGRDVQGAEPLVEFDDYFLRVLEANDVDVEAVRNEALSLLESGAYDGPSSLPIPDELADLFPRARDVDMADHVRVQAAFQEHVDGAVSKTVNVAHDADRERIADAYHLAADLACKGVTVYRSGSRSGQVLSTEPEGDGNEERG